ncbi:1-acyl-sn-glycerol-3-phosphate acyltransferase [Monosporozyma unispora]|nr:1-acylglycerol-3-phosphate O-acyltransferase [Kazachstania unispora]
MGNPVLYYMRCVTAVAILMLCAVYGTIASIVCNIIGKQHLSQWTTARCYYYAMKFGMGIDVKVIGEEKLDNKPFIAVSNHQSALDILMLARMFPKGCTVTAKKSLKYVPLLGWFMAASGTFFLDRSSRQKSVDTLNRGLRQVKEKKRALWIFPEGTRSYATDLSILPFKKGAFHLAQQGDIPIVPIVVSNTSTLMNPKNKVFNRGVMTVKVLDPVSTDGLTKEDIGAFSEKIRESMVETLQEIGYSKPVNETNLPQDYIDYVTKKRVAEESEDSKSKGASTGVSA